VGSPGRRAGARRGEPGRRGARSREHERRSREEETENEREPDPARERENERETESSCFSLGVKQSNQLILCQITL
jgi:hypothetical protein